MKVVRLPEGKPGQHLGISHAVKHYLSPSEMWEDLAADLPESVRPAAVIEALGDAGQLVWEQWGGDVQPALAARWDDLKNAYHVGYIALVTEQSAEARGPDQAPSEWVRDDTGRTTALGDSGILYKVRQRAAGWEMYTAFRPYRFPYSAHWCPPRDAANVSIRRRISAWRAHQWLAYRRTDGEDR